MPLVAPLIRLVHFFLQTVSTTTIHVRAPCPAAAVLLVSDKSENPFVFLVRAEEEACMCLAHTRDPTEPTPPTRLRVVQLRATGALGGAQSLQGRPDSRSALTATAAREEATCAPAVCLPARARGPAASF
eukprot:2057167-Rhodomonas_salina.1